MASGRRGKERKGRGLECPVRSCCGKALSILPLIYDSNQLTDTPIISPIFRMRKRRLPEGNTHSQQVTPSRSVLGQKICPGARTPECLLFPRPEPVRPPGQRAGFPGPWVPAPTRNSLPSSPGCSEATAGLWVYISGQRTLVSVPLSTPGVRTCPCLHPWILCSVTLLS